MRGFRDLGFRVYIYICIWFSVQGLKILDLVFTDFGYS